MHRLHEWSVNHEPDHAESQSGFNTGKNKTGSVYCGQQWLHAGTTDVKMQGRNSVQDLNDLPHGYSMTPEFSTLSGYQGLYLPTGDRQVKSEDVTDVVILKDYQDAATQYEVSDHNVEVVRSC
jgi:hypothetical protein